jgi:hypothetical protein
VAEVWLTMFGKPPENRRLPKKWINASTHERRSSLWPIP